MSLDVSPDGRTVAFDLLGDIYLLPMEGGTARAIDSGLAWSMQPRFSPDGTKIAYTSDAGGSNNIWIMETDGSDKRQLTSEEFRLLNNPTWSPDGDYIAARKHFTTERSMGTGEIWMYHVDGGAGIPVVKRPDERHQKELGEPAWSPDGRYIYFTVDGTPGFRFTYARDSNGQIFEIRRHDLETHRTRSIVTGNGGAVRPEPSPDGRYLAFVRRLKGRSALFVKDLTSGAVTPVYRELDQDLQEVWAVHGLYPNMDWTPDSRSIVFWAGGKIRRIDLAGNEAVDIPFEVRDTRTVLEPPRPSIRVAPPTFEARMVRGAAVSPDGSQIVFEVTGRLYHKSLPDGSVRRLTSDSGDHFEYFPSWSTDGQSIVFVTWSDTALGHIHSVSVEGGLSTRLTRKPGHYLYPRFAPDDQTIVFEATRGGRLTSPDWSILTGVLEIPAAGGQIRLITDDGRRPHFGARGDRLYVSREIDGKNALVSIDRNGAAAHTHATGKYVTQYEVAPSGKYLAYRENYHIYAVPLPPGGEPLELGTSIDTVPMTRASGDGGNYPHWSGDGRTLRWSLGATVLAAQRSELFVNAADGTYVPPTDGISLKITLEGNSPSGGVALTGARIITMDGDDGGIIADGTVVTDGNRIRAIGPRGSIRIPEGIPHIDVSGKTIIPGLIDAHAHGPQGVDIIPRQNWEAYATLALGVTTIHDPSNDAREIFAAAEMQRTGRILAPRIFSTGDTIYGARSREYAEVDSLQDALHHVRRLKAQGASSIKNYNQPRREQRQQITTAARQENLLVVGEGASLYHMDMSMIADGISTVEHNLPQSMIYDDVLQFWPQTNVAYTPTLVVTYGGLSAEAWWYQETEVWRHPILSNFVPPDVLRSSAVRRILAPASEYHHTSAAAAAKLLADRGVLVSIGAHGQREGLASHWEIWSFVQAGMTPVQALEAATISPARALGFDRDIGSLEKGKLADLVIIDARNLLENIRQSDQISMVMLNGRLYKAATLDELHTGDHRTAPFYWQRTSDSPACIGCR